MTEKNYLLFFLLVFICSVVAVVLECKHGTLGAKDKFLVITGDAF